MRKLALSLLLGTLTLLGTTACGPSEAVGNAASGNASAGGNASSADGPAFGFAFSAEAEALAVIGAEAEDIVIAETGLEPSPASKDKRTRLDNWHKRKAAHVALHRNVLHGEAVVQTKAGPVTILVQRGIVTAISADSVTVKSTDGFTLTWKFHEKLRVVEKRATIQPSDIKPGATLFLAGPKVGDTPTARLVIVPLSK